MASQEDLRDTLLPRVESVQVGLRKAFESQGGVESVAFYANPPWKGKDHDLDVLIVLDEGEVESVNLDDVLQNLSSANDLELDVWILTRSQLIERMQRIAGVNSDKPKILGNIESWGSFAFVSVAGGDTLSELIDHCYGNPQDGGPIPPSSEEQRRFVPQVSK